MPRSHNHQANRESFVIPYIDDFLPWAECNAERGGFDYDPYAAAKDYGLIWPYGVSMRDLTRWLREQEIEYGIVRRVVKE